jgi:6-pyruvoyltetrahydropterin/6-carboxytetrahydropterin synthase
MKLTQRYRFSASHRLHSHELDAERNVAVYGKCNNPFGHGHNYWLEVSVEGEPDAATGMVAPRRKLDEWIGEEILAWVDHRNLNQETEEFRRIPPTTENVAAVFVERLAKGWPKHFGGWSGLRFAGIRIYETRNNLFEVQRNEVQQ